MRGLLFLVVLTAAALWWGLPNVYVGIRNREPLEITCADYLKQRPSDKWLRLTHCEADIANLATEEATDHEIRRVYVPLRPEGAADAGRTEIVVERDDREMRDAAAKLRQDNPTDAMIERVHRLLAEPTEGLVKFGIDLSDKDQEQLRRLGIGLADDFVMIDRGAKPHFWAALGVSLAGLAVLGVFVRALVRRRKPAAASHAPAPPAQ
jgi:hypothetical protein